MKKLLTAWQNGKKLTEGMAALTIIRRPVSSIHVTHSNGTENAADRTQGKTAC